MWSAGGKCGERISCDDYEACSVPMRVKTSHTGRRSEQHAVSVLLESQQYQDAGLQY